MRQARRLLLVVLLFTMAASGQRRDPLTQGEVDDLRAAAMEPHKRLQLYIQFAEARLLDMDQLRADPKSDDGRGKRIHGLLQDFTAILDESTTTWTNTRAARSARRIARIFAKA
jgi:hypothetical protein